MQPAADYVQHHALITYGYADYIQPAADYMHAHDVIATMSHH